MWWHKVGSLRLGMPLAVWAIALLAIASTIPWHADNAGGVPGSAPFRSAGEMVPLPALSSPHSLGAAKAPAPIATAVGPRVASPATSSYWSSVLTPTAPSDRGSAAMAYDPDVSGLILFGGAGPGQTVPTDTWLFANDTWTNLTPFLSVSPPARSGAAMAYDTSDGYLLMFGGISGFGGHAMYDTWKFENGAWTNLTIFLNPSPPARYSGGMTYDSINNEIVLFGGYGLGGGLGDTWVFSTGAWSDLTSTLTTSPPARSYTTFAFDAADGYSVLFGGVDAGSFQYTNDTWLFQNDQWRDETSVLSTAPSPRRAAALSYDAGDAEIALFGGQTASGPISNEFWTYSQGAWAQATPFPVAWPPARFVASLTDVPALNQLVLFGGCTVVGCGNAVNDTWAHPEPIPLSVGLSATPTLVELGQAATIGAAAAGGLPPYQYAYSGLPAGCPSYDLALFVCFPASTGTFSIVVTVTDFASDSSSSPSAPLQVVEAPSATVAGTSATDVGLPVVLGATLAGGLAPYTVTWHGLPTGCASTNSPGIACTALSAGIDQTYVTVRDALGGVTTSLSHSVTINALPGVTLLVPVPAGPAPFTVGLLASPSDGTAPFSIQWALGDGTSGSGLAITHTYAVVGNYTVEVWATDAVGSSTHAATVVSVSPLTPPAQDHTIWKNTTRYANTTTTEGFPITTLGAVAAVTLLAGAAIGWVLASRRRVPPKRS